MTEFGPLRHGGGLQAAMSRYGGARKDWMDLSTGISPYPYPFGDVSPEAYARLPEQYELDQLLLCARQAYQVPDELQIAAAPGTQALIQLLPSLLTKGKALVDDLGYQEHGRCWRLAGHDLQEAADPLATALDDPRVRYATIIHPHNPSGAWADPQAVEMAAQALAARGGLLVVDEAFCDGTPERSFIPRLLAGAVVLRSFGKFYGLAGVRVGFAVGPPDLIERLQSHLGPWAVPGPAIEIARQGLADDTWRIEMISQLAQHSSRLADVLQANGFEPFGQTYLFVTARHANAAQIEEKLAEQCILVRGFDQAPDLLRFGLPATDEQFERLAAALVAATK
ncbi:MAG: threonine-phosphate decarboxylase CobD [Pseudomonadota bacterium]